MELKGAVINFLGDSITEGVGASCEENRYTDVFSRLYGAKVNNYGISGSRFARQRINTGERHEQDFCMRFETMDKSADAVVVFGRTTLAMAMRRSARLRIAIPPRSTARVII